MEAPNQVLTLQNCSFDSCALNQSVEEKKQH
jgi:hypothetical protein